MTTGGILRDSVQERRDRNLPPPAAETGRWSVGNRKERLRDYASFPGVQMSNVELLNTLLAIAGLIVGVVSLTLTLIKR